MVLKHKGYVISGVLLVTLGGLLSQCQTTVEIYRPPSPTDLQERHMLRMQELLEEQKKMLIQHERMTWYARLFGH